MAEFNFYIEENKTTALIDYIDKLTINCLTLSNSICDDMQQYEYVNKLQFQRNYFYQIDKPIDYTEKIFLHKKEYGNIHPHSPSQSIKVMLPYIKTEKRIYKNKEFCGSMYRGKIICSPFGCSPLGKKNINSDYRKIVNFIKKIAPNQLHFNEKLGMENISNECLELEKQGFLPCY